MKRIPSHGEPWQLLQLEYRREVSRWNNLRAPTVALFLLLLLAWLLGLIS